MPRTGPNRLVELAGVNATKTLFDSLGYVFLSVPQEHDFGKDAYVDLVDGREVTGVTVAIQVKSGPSFKRAEGYAIPIGSHFEVWRDSSVPIVGIVYDPDIEQLHWCDITEFLENVEGEPPASIPVGADKILTAQTIETEFKPQMRRTAGHRSVGVSFLQLCSGSAERKFAALSDCFGLGRSDARVLIVLRNLLGLLSGDHLRYALRILAHATSHPDIFWTKDNWIEEDVRQVVKPHLHWRHDEIERFFTEINQGEWERGSSGQDLVMLLFQDSEIEDKLEKVAIHCIESGNDEAAYSAFYLTLYLAGKKATRKFNRLVHHYPRFMDIELVSEIGIHLCEFGFVTLFE